MRAALIGLLVVMGACRGRAPEGVVKQRFAVSTANALSTNRMTGNRMTGNALTANALTANRMTGNSLQNIPELTAALTDPTPTPDGQTYGAWAREVLAYIYGCAMPAGTEMDLILDGIYYGTLQGAIGLAPEWQDGPCEQSCQRWVSACLLARTNYYGVPVDISIRGDHPALATTPAEEAAFPLREGSYYGNLFQPLTPERFACFGPASSMPELTARVCSTWYGQGGSSVTCAADVLGPCQDTACEIGMCAGVDPIGGARDCWTAEFGPTGPHYDEVITVYLAQPQPVCGNGICESGESVASCDDCQPGWARAVGGDFPQFTGATAGAGGISYAAGMFGPGSVDPGGGELTAPSEDGFIVAYDADGSHLWSKRLGCDALPLPQLAADATGLCLVAKVNGSCTLPGGVSVTAQFPGLLADAFVARLDLAGDAQWVVPLTGPDREDVRVHATGDGGCLVTVDFGTSLTVGGDSTLASAGSYDTVVARFDAGAATWIRHIKGPGFDTALAAVDVAGGHVVVGGDFMQSLDTGGAAPITAAGNATYLARYALADGAHIASRALWDDLTVYGIAADAAGVAVTGFGAPPGTTGYSYVAALDPAGEIVWARGYDVGGDFYELRLDGAGHVLGLASFAGRFDLGGTSVVTGDVAVPDAVVVSYARADGQLRWLRQLGGLFGTGISQLEIDAQTGQVLVAGHLLLGGVFSGFLIGAPTGAGGCFAQGVIHRFADPSLAEACNGVDDDGDGRVDEGLGAGAACDGVADDDWCGEGVSQCGAAGFSCSDQTGHTLEICVNDWDDDCDGLVDENFPVPCTPASELPDAGVIYPPDAGVPDAGTGAADAGAGGPDGGGPGGDGEGDGGGCGCRVGERDAGAPAGAGALPWLLAGVLPWLAWRARRRRQSRGSSPSSARAAR